MYLHRVPGSLDVEEGPMGGRNIRQRQAIESFLSRVRVGSMLNDDVWQYLTLQGDCRYLVYRIVFYAMAIISHSFLAVGSPQMLDF